MFYVDVLESLKDKGWYIGFTTNLNRRLKYHNEGSTKSTKERRPLRIIYFEGYLNKKDALGCEKFLKSGAGWKLLKKQMKHFISDLS